MFFLTDEWNEQFGHLPWYRRYEFLVPGVAVLIGLLFFMIPSPGKPDGFLSWLRILLSYFLFFGWVLLVLSDKEKPVWLKRVSSIATVLLFFLFSEFTYVSDKFDILMLERMYHFYQKKLFHNN